jgi:hypothetical protein
MDSKSTFAAIAQYSDLVGLLFPYMKFVFALAANVRSPPFMSKCAWCSNLTVPYLIIVTHGPNLPFCLNGNDKAFRKPRKI